MKLTVLMSSNASKRKKNFFLAVLFLSLVLFSNNSYSQTLSDWEFNVYYDFVGKFFDLEDWYEGNEEGVAREVAAKYNISYEQTREIIDRAFEREPSDWEWDLGEEIYKKFSSVPKELQTNYERDKIFREFENKYSISRNYINDVLYRTIWDIMMYYSMFE